MKRRDEIFVGLFTLIGIALLIASLVWLSRGGLSRGYPLYAQFAWGAGVKQGQPVLFSGANIGYVDEVRLLDSGLVVVMRISKKQRVPAGSVASIAPYGIFGDKLIALKPTRGPSGQYLNPGDTIPSGRGSVELDEVMARVDTIARGLNTLMSALKTELVDQGAIRTVRLTAHSADSLFRVIADLAKVQSAELTKTQETLRNVATSLDSARLKPVVDRLTATTASADSLLKDFRVTNQQFKSLMAKVESGPGLASKLLNDPAYAEKLFSTMSRLDSLMADFKANPRKYIRLSIF